MSTSCPTYLPIPKLYRPLPSIPQDTMVAHIFTLNCQNRYYSTYHSESYSLGIAIVSN